METSTLILIIVLAVAAVAALIWWKRRQTRNLRARYGPEYDRLVREGHPASRAETELRKRERRFSKYKLRPLTPSERERLTTEWQHVQEDFVDHPHEAIQRADTLIRDALSRRGFPDGEFEQRAADISVENADVVQHYRAAHAIAVGDTREQVDTEDLRRALQHYRAVFEEVAAVSIALFDKEVHPHAR